MYHFQEMMTTAFHSCSKASRKGFSSAEAADEAGDVEEEGVIVGSAIAEVKAAVEEREVEGMAESPDSKPGEAFKSADNLNDVYEACTAQSKGAGAAPVDKMAEQVQERGGGGGGAAPTCKVWKHVMADLGCLHMRGSFDIFNIFLNVYQSNI